MDRVAQDHLCHHDAGSNCDSDVDSDQTCAGAGSDATDRNMLIGTVDNDVDDDGSDKRNCAEMTWLCNK